MAIAAPPAPGAKESVRQKRERDQELLVWPDLVFVEFICAVLFTVTFVGLSVLVNAPLLDRANANITPNPSKAPWYLMNLQELLLHMDKGLAGVTVPTVALIVLMAIPYTDRSNEGQGTWFGTAHAVKITIFSMFYSFATIFGCVLWDDGAHVRVYTQFRENISGHGAQPWRWPWDVLTQRDHFVAPAEPHEWLQGYHPFEWAGPLTNVLQKTWEFVFLPNRLAVRDSFHFSLPVPTALQFGNGQHDGYLDWPQDFREIPVPLNGTWLWHWGEPKWMPGWLRHLYWYNSDFNIPAIIAEFVMPIATILFIAAALLFILHRLGWLNSVRDGWLAMFTGFIVVYISLTMVGAAFRGRGQQLVPPPNVPNLEDDPGIMRQITPQDLHYGITDPSGVSAIAASRDEAGSGLNG